MDVLLIRVLRYVVSQAGGDVKGLLAGLSDPQLGIAIRAVPEEISCPWKVANFATLAGMSRSAFAARFRKIVGLPPLDYLIQWRIAVAKGRLRSERHSLTFVADRVGYRSVSAFSTAFKRCTGDTKPCSQG